MLFRSAEAAKRLCDALRAAGVEVWFDQSELVGGDAWDQKIRKQIRECALLIPVISKTTQGRREAYFRLEWKLADERTHLMAKGTPFLLPVTIDETSDRDALVPDSFLAVQWTRAPGGEAPAMFAARVKKVLFGEVGPVSDRPHSAAGGAEPRPSMGPQWLRPVLASAVIVIVVLAVTLKKASDQPAKPTATPTESPPAVSQSNPLNGQTEAQKLVAQAAQMLESGDELNREIYFLAEDLVKRALTLEPANAPAAALAAEISYRMTWFGFDRTRARLTTMRQQAERALALAPHSVEARLAHAEAMTALNENLSGALTATLQLAREVSGNWRVQRALAEVYRQLKQSDAALVAYQKSQQLSGGDPAAAANLVNYMLMLGRTAEAETVVNETLARRTGSRLIALDVLLKTQWRGDTAAATAALAQWPDWLLREDRGAHLAWQAWYWHRQPDRALAAAQLATRDYLRDAYFNGPRAALTALAQEMAGHPEAAQADWREVVELTNRELVTDSQDASALYWKAWALERLGEHSGAHAIGALIQQRNLPATANIFRFRPIAPLWATLGQRDDAVADLQGRVAATDRYAVNRAMLELDPALASLQTDPRFAELVKRAPAPTPATAPASKAVEKSVAVLAFANLSDDKANEYFSDGISEELLNVLAKIPDLKVTARTSSFHFKGTNTAIPEIARQLGVAYVVEGSVRKQGDKVRITAQLIKAADGFHVWSDTFTRELKDIFAVQDEIAGLIAKNLELKMGMKAAARVVNPEAYALYLQGRAILNRGMPGDYPKAIQCFKDSLGLDSDSAPTWAWLATAYNFAGAQGILGVDQGFALSRESAVRAIALDPELAQGHVALGLYELVYEWDWAKATGAVQRATALAPGDASILSAQGLLAQTLGQTEQALLLAQKAVALDPLNFISAYTLAKNYFFAGRFEEMEQQAEHMIALNPGGRYGHIFRTFARLQLGRIDDAAKAAEQVPPSMFRLVGLALVRHAQGRAAESNQALDELKTSFSEGAAYQIAEVYAYRHETDQAFQWLDRAMSQRDSGMTWILHDPFLNNLHSDDRWRALLQKMNLAGDHLK